MIIAAVLPICGVGVIGYQQRLKARKAQLQEKLRRQQALHVAVHNLKTISLAEPKTSYQQIDNVFKAYIADKLNMKVEAVKQSDLSQLLKLNQVSEDVLLKAQSFIAEIEEGVFSPTVDAISPKRLQSIIKRLSEIDAEWIVQ
jgi:thiamine biosynthesis lipoprotein ApbE